MSATIYYKPVVPEKHKYLENVGAPSSFMESLKKALDRDMPMTLSIEDIPALKGMAAVYGGSENPYEELIELLEKHETLFIWAEY